MGIFIHEKAIVHDGAKIGEGTRVWANTNIQQGAVIGSGCNICDGSFVEKGAVVGNNVTVKHNMISLNKEYGVRLGGCSGNFIIENNFIENEESAYFIYIYEDQNNKFDKNYWDRPRVLPKTINGFIVTMVNEQIIWIPWIEFDWHPAKRPYDI